MRPLALVLLCMATSAFADPIVLQSTTSTQASGLYDHLLPAFKDASGLDVLVVAVGTGQALRNAQNCDGDLVLVHAKTSEEAFVAAGYGKARLDVMYNDFVLIGPAGNPAALTEHDTIFTALQKIQNSESRFASRGDDSGTHKAERQLWEAINLQPDPLTARWYLETGAGMGATLNTGLGLDAYVLSDRATWLRFANKGDAVLHVEGDAALFNQYGIVTLSKDHCPLANHTGAQALVDWLTGPEGQSQIAAFRLNGTAVFFPNAQP